MSNTDELPVKTGEDFLAEAEVMDLRPLLNEQFLVGVSSGPRDKAKFVSTTVRGPFSFAEMVQDVGDMWRTEQHHAKVLIANKDRSSALKSLDVNTVDYIECHYIDIITEAMLDGTLDREDYTCRPGITEDEEFLEAQAEKLKKAEDGEDVTE